MDQPVPHRSPTRERDTQIAKTMFVAGLFCLPWLWILLLLRYWRDLLDVRTPARMRFYLISSALGTIVMTALFLSWVILFQLNWQSWGHIGLNLLIYVPSADVWWLD